MRNSHTKQFTQRQLILLNVVIVIIISLFLTLFFRSNISNLLVEETERTMINSVQQDKELLWEKFKGIFSNMQLLSEEISQAGIRNYPYSAFPISQRMQMYKFSHMGVIDINGNGIVGPNLNLRHFPGLKDSIHGMFRIAYTPSTPFGDKRCLIISHPISDSYRDKTTGVLYGIYGIKEMNEIFGVSSEGNHSDSFVIDINGDILIPVKNKELLEKLQNFFVGWQEPDAKSDMVDLFTKIRQTGSGVELITMGDGSQYYIAGTSIRNVSDMYVLNIIPASAVADRIHSILNTVTTVLVILLVILLALFTNREHLKRNQEMRFNQLAFVDDLTQLGNMATYQRDFYEIMSEKHSGGIDVVSIDIDHMKSFNDTMGYAYGDNIIKKVGALLSRSLAEGEECYRVNNDVFYLIIFAKDEVQDDQRIQGILDYVSATYKASFHHSLTFSCGIYHVPGSSQKERAQADQNKERGKLDARDCGGNADLARKKIKGKDVNTIGYFDAKFVEQLNLEREIEDAFQPAMEKGEFVMYYQPKYRIDGDVVTLGGAEALIRWISPTRGFMPPGMFIPLFDKDGNAEIVDMHVAKLVCKNISDWLQKGLPLVPVSINISRQSIMRGEKFVSEFEGILKEYNIPKRLIEIEVLESSNGEDQNTLLQFLRFIRHRGFHIAMDDFGSGYSSLGMFSRMSLDCLKLDKSFFDDWHKNMIPAEMALVEHIIKVAQATGKTVVAEGVEEEYQVRILRRLGCNMIQGYYFSKPLPEADFINKLVNPEVEMEF